MSGVYDPDMGAVSGDGLRFHLKCTVKFVEDTVALSKKGGGVGTVGKDLTVILVPDYNTTEFAKFMSCYNPDDYELVEAIEFVCRPAYPITQLARIAYKTKNEKVNEAHYFRLATLDVEDKIKNRLREGATLMIEILPLEEEIESGV